MEIRDSKLYRVEHGTFEDFCKLKWNLKQSRAYQMMDAAKATMNVKSSTMVEVSPTSERQARPLTKLSPVQQLLARHGNQP
jgi:hypothetical protein